MTTNQRAGFLALFLLAGCGGGATNSASPAPEPVVPDAVVTTADAGSDASTAHADRTGARTHGILLMAHGGTEAWNRSAAQVAASLQAEAPTALAFGMANPATLRASLDSLQTAGVDRVAVVRMFLSGSSFRTQTDWLLGMSDDRPAHFISHGGHGQEHGGGHHAGEGHGGHGANHPPADPWAPIDHGLTIATHDDGLMDAAEAAPILRDRARELSVDPAGESVLLVGHGMGDDERNDAVLRAMARAASPLRQEGFAAVKVTTLREDWPEVREVAEAEIVDFARSEVEAGRRLLVLPFRLFGFGPYAEVLGDLPYTPGQGLLPNDRIAGWAVRQARRIFCANGWETQADTCPPSSVMTDPISEAERIEPNNPGPQPR